MDAEPADARMEAFCKLDAPGVFNAVVSPTQIWQWDPYDVDTIHAEARDVFARLLNRATTETERGRVLLLMGEAGSGKTHLMRAFRAMAHESRQAHFGYLQLTTAAASYERYILANLINSMENPYFPPAVAESGLQRLSAALLDAVPGITPDAAEHFRNGTIAPDELPNIVRKWTHHLIAVDRFGGCDEDLIAVLLYLQRNDRVVRGKALKWLRCENLNDHDRKFIGDLYPRPDPNDAFTMVQSLARLMRVAQDTALILCVDQLEDVFDQESGVDRFVKVVDLLVALADASPNVVALLSCLEDYYKQNAQRLKKSKLDRIEASPAPVRLSSPRTLEEIKRMVARRVATVFDAAGLPVDDTSTFPYTDDHLRPLDRLGSRTILNWLQQHHDQCAAAGGWVEPGGAVPAVATVSPVDDFDRMWNDASTAAGPAPDAEADLTAVLARSIGHCVSELPREFAAVGQVEGNTVSFARGSVTTLVAVCDKGAPGGGLARQLAEVAKKAAGRPVVIVRSVPFPVSARSQVSIELGKLLGTTGRRVQASDADWRAMAAFDSFAAGHPSHPGFADWQRRSRPLGQLRTMQVVLDLKPVEPRVVTFSPPLTMPVQPPKPTVAAPTPPVVPEVKVGTTRELVSSPVFIQPEDIKRHMAFIGGSGSGKTTVALRIIEHLLARGIPCVLVDRKGDLARYADPAAWDVPDDPAQPGYGQRRRWLRDHLDVDLFTPGSGDKGRPLTLPIAPDDLSSLSEGDREEAVQFAAESLGGMLKLDPRKDVGASMLAILGKAIEVLTAAGREVDVESLRALIGDMDPTLVNAVGGYDDKRYKKLAESLLTLQLRNARLLTGGGERLDTDKMFARSPRPRLTIINTQSLAADAVDFWVSQFLSTVHRWRARNPSPTLRAVLLLDEADQYLPATRKPATKAPLEALLRQARSAGLGIMLATQQPGDLDYKGRDNILTWLIGLVKESNSINKLRPMLLASRGDVADKLPTQSVGEFYYLREGQVTPVKAGMSLVKTEQLPLEKTLKLAKDRPKLV